MKSLGLFQKHKLNNVGIWTRGKDNHALWLSEPLQLVTKFHQLGATGASESCILL